MVYIDIVRRSLSDLTISNMGTRRELYDQLRVGLNATLDSVEPPIDPKDREIELRLLSMTVRRFELDIRSGIDVWSDDYNPVELQEAQAKLYSFKTANRVSRHGTVGRHLPGHRLEPGTASTEQGARNEQFFEQLRRQMLQLSQAKRTAGITEEPPLAPWTVRAIILRKFREVSAKSSLGLLWLIFEPALYVAAIVGVYTYLGRTDVMDMEVAAFALTGVLTMLMFRQTIIRVATVFTSEGALLCLPPVQLISVAFSQGAMIYVTFNIAAAAAIALIVIFDFGPGPVNWQMVLFYWTAMWIFAVSLGIVLGYGSTYTLMVMRVTAIAFRVVSALSGIFFVSEQFPEEYTRYLLWNPLLHGVQLLRSSYFAGYKSTDANVDFFLCCVGATIAYAAACERITRTRVEPA